MRCERVEIDLDSSDPALTRLERHGYVNLINVVHAELQLIERMVELPGSLRSAVHLAEAASRAFKEIRAARRHLGEFVRFGDLIASDIDEVLAEAGALSEDEDVREAVAIVRDVLPDAHLRVQEVLARHRLDRPVEHLDVRTLELELRPTGLEFAGPHGTVAVPEGTGRALRELSRQGDDDDRDIDITLARLEAAPDSRTTTLSLRGTGNTASIALLHANLRPSELHRHLTESDGSIRPLLVLAYLAVPGGCAQVTTEDDTREGRDDIAFVYEACLPEPEPVVESD